MPSRARARSALSDPHELLSYRDTRALEVARQKLEHPRDRRRSKGPGGQGVCRCGFCDNHDRAPLQEFRRSRGGRPLEVKGDDLNPRLTAAEVGGGWEGGKEKRHPGQGVVDLWGIAKPGRVRRDLPKGYEVVPRVAEVVVLDDDEEVEKGWEDEYEIVDLPVTAKPKREKARRKEASFAQAVKGKRGGR